MKRIKFCLWGICVILLFGLGISSCQTEEQIDLRIIHTTDVHGNIFPYDYINDKPGTGSLARLSTLMQAVRKESPNTLLLDAGDLLQGEPTTYYTNYIDTLSPNLIAETMNYLGYDAATIGNHDVEPGHRVFDKWVKECNFPILAANVVNTETGKPYFTPYKVFELGGAKVAVIGFLTPAIPQWVPQKMWTGMRFDDIITSAKQWIPQLQSQEKPDLIVAMLHSGLQNDNEDYLENAGESFAKEIGGVDLMLLGHDHRKYSKWVKRSPTDSVLIINPANHLDFASDIRISIKKKGGKVVGKSIEASFADINAYDPDLEYMSKFKDKETEVRQFLGKTVGLIADRVVGEEALWGSSAYMSVIHAMQRSTVDAEISFAAPLALQAVVDAGDVHARDLFKFCPFSNYLYAMELTGQEIHGYLEHSYAQWTNQMKSKDDHLLLFRADAKPSDKYKTAHPTFNYSAAEGIDYTVDVSKPAGQRVTITQLSTGEPFDLARKYRVAVNSYRAGGAGGMLTVGAGIPKDELPNRIVAVSDYDQFFSLMKYIEHKNIIQPQNPNNWRFLPSAWIPAAIERDRAFLQAK